MKKIGREVLFLSCNNENARNGEGSFIRLKDGSILFGYTEYIGNNWNDHADARISCYTSYDEGETWTDKRVLIEKPVDSFNVMSLSFLRMGNGDIGAFYIFKNQDGTDKICLIRSTDEGKTWSEPLNCFECLERPDYYVLNNDRVIMLKSGRILIPLAKHTIYKNPSEPGIHSTPDGQRRIEYGSGVICFFYSDDDGRTWQKNPSEYPLPYPTDSSGYQEPGLYQFEDGRVWCYIRTALGCQFECFSSDNGDTWTTPAPNHFFTSPVSPMLVKDVGPYTAAIFNPTPVHMLCNHTVWGRTPYVCAVSDDRGQTFRKDRVFYLEDDLNNGYCYPAIIEGDDYFLAAYYHSNNTGICLNSTKIIKVLFSEIAE